MAIVESSSLGFTPANLSPFTTVNNGGARPLKDIAASEFNLLRNGSTVYVESVRDYYKWNPLLTEADDTGSATSLNKYCNPTVNGVSPGRFERLFIYSPDWRLQDFVIDSATGHNENSGVLGAPLANDLELFQRWGANCNIETVRTVTYAQAPTTVSNYDVNIFPDASLTLLGTPEVTKPGVLITAVQAQVRTPGAEVRHAITGATLGAADVGKLAVIVGGTLANIGAYAKILKDEGGGKVIVSPFGIAAPGEFPGFTEITPIANVDVIDVIEPTELLVGALRFRNFTRSSPFTSNPPFNCAVCDGLTLNGDLSNFGAGELFADGLIVQYARCNLKDIQVSGQSPIAAVGHNLLGGGVDNWLMVNCVGLFFQKSGCLDAAVDVNTGGFLVTGTDAYFQGCFTSVFQGGEFSSAGSSFFDCPTSNQNLLIAYGGHYEQFGPIPDWGTNNTGHGVRVLPFCSYVYQVKPSINGTLGAGREALIGGTDKQYAAFPAGGFIEPANNAGIVLRA